MVACCVDDCKSTIKYNIGAGTTSGMINHLKQCHQIFVKEKNSIISGKARTTHDSTPYSMYSAEYMNITKGVLFHLIKDKISLNSVESEGYRFLLKRLNAR
jgi:hypothetical protein